MSRLIVFYGWFCLAVSICALSWGADAGLPGTVEMSNDAGRGDLLFVNIRMNDGPELPFVIDTGSPITLIAKSLEPQLGTQLGSRLFWNFGRGQSVGIYAMPKLYLGKTLLQAEGETATFDSQQFAYPPKRTVDGILGMDVLKHYCLQMDFKKGKVRFLATNSTDKADWGQPFPLTDVGDGCFLAEDNLVGTPGEESLIDTGCDGDGWLTPGLFERWTNHITTPYAGEIRSPDGILGGHIYHHLNLRAEVNHLNDTYSRRNGIGLRLLARNLVTFDFPNKVMYLKPVNDWPLVDPAVEAKGKSADKSALRYLKHLVFEEKLPGMYSYDFVEATSYYYSHQDTPYLDSLTYDVRVNGYRALNHYTVVRNSKHGDWKLTRAWRTDSEGRVDKEYTLP